MAVTFAWYEKLSSTITFDFDKQWQWSEFYEAVDQWLARPEMVGKTHKVVFDFSHSHSAPTNLMTHCPAILNKLPAHIELVVVISYGNMMSRIHQLVEMMQRNPHGPTLLFLSHKDDVQEAIQRHPEP